MQHSLLASGWGSSKWLKLCLGLVSLLLAMIWAPQASASLGCGIQVSGAATATTAPGVVSNFAVNVVNTGACASVVNLAWTISGDTTGGTATTPTFAIGAPAPGIFNFTATAGPVGGGTATVTVTCTAGCVNAATTAVYTVNTTTNYAFTRTSPASITTNQSTPFTLSTNLLVNGAGSGATYSTNFFRLPSGPSLATVVNSGAGNASTTNIISSSGTFNIEGRVICPTALPGCPPAPVPFTVVVEPSSLTPVSASSVGIISGGSTVIQARYGGPTVPTVLGDVISWTVSGPLGNAVLSSPSSTTNAAGIAQVTLTSSVPGTYTVTGSSGDTFSLDPTESFTVTVTAIVRTLVVSSGNGQTAPTSSALPAPLVVLAQNNAVNAPGITINWTTTGGTLSAASSVTGAGGLANIGLTLPATIGPVTVTATRADDGTAIATFDATATLIRTLAVSSGNGQSAPTSTPLSAPLVVLAQNNAVNAPGITINWTTTGGTLSAASSVTGAGGLANIGLTLPATAGPVTVTATRADDGTAIATFTVTATLIRTLAVSSGNGQTAPTGTPLPAPLVVLAQNNAVNAPGITINWTTTGGTLSAASSVTGAGGLANIGLTLPATSGVVTITGTRADDATVFATFTATATLVRTLTITSGNSQNATPGSPLPAPLVVNARNNGIATAGVVINWTISPGSTLGAAANVTSGTGAASNTATLSTAPGTVTVTATRQDDPTVFVTFIANGVKLANIPNLTSSQLSLATALDNICRSLNNLNSPTASQIDFRTRCQELANNAALNPGDVVRALNALLPDTQAAQSRASMLTASRQFETISARIAALRSGSQGGSFDGLALQGRNGSISLGSLVNSLTGDAATPEVGADFQRWGFFASGTIGSGDANAAGITPSFDFNIHGLTLGVDYRQSDKFIFGAALGYTNQDTKLAPGQGGVDASGYTLSAYSTYFKDNSWYTDAVLTFGKNNYDLERQINYTIPDGLGGFTNVNQTARSDSGGDLLSLGATFGRDFQKGGWSIGPYGRVLYTRLNFDRIQESLVSSGPGAGLALIVEERSLDSLASVIGGKFTRAFSTSWGVLTPHFQLEWEHEFNTDPGSVTARFVNDPTGTTIVLSDAPYDADYFRIGLGLSAIMSKGRSGFMYYDKTLGRDGITQDNLAIGFRLEF